MGTLLKLAWRNIWRNKRRTYITAASILFAVLFGTFMEALQKGAWENMINNVVNYYYGFIQIHEDGYWDDQSIDKAIPVTEEILNLEKEIKEIKTVIPRLESFALASTGETTLGVMLIGTEPQREIKMTALNERLIEGEYLNKEDKKVLLAKGVAEKLNLTLNDTIILISQGYHGANAAGKYPIKGIVSFGSPELNKQMVYLPLKEAQWFYAADGLVTSIALHIEDQEKIASTVTKLKSKLDAEAYEIMDWKELLPDLVEAKALDSGGNYVVYFILYLIIAFGIFGTILMMTKEREYEFGILIAIGMKRWMLGATIWIEVILLGMLGTILGLLLSYPLVYYFHVNPIRFGGGYADAMEKFGFEPIFPTTMKARIFFIQALVVFLITAVLALFPFYKIFRLAPVKAMRD